MQFLYIFREKEMKRRQFNGIIIGGILFSFFGIHWLRSEKDRLTALFSHYNSALAVGQQYLHQFPEESNYHWLISQVFPVPSLPVSQLKTQLKKQRQQDFSESQTVIVHGWILSRTEARLCAALALA